MIEANNWEIDPMNDRIVAYFPEITESDLKMLVLEKQKQSVGKIIVYTLKSDFNELKEIGFIEEASMSGFFDGKNACIYSLFTKPKRQMSDSLEENKEVLKVVRLKKEQSGTKWENIIFLPPKENQLVELASLYDKVFQIYPTNISDPGYLKNAIESDYLFVVALEGTKIIGSASAMLTAYNSAEITDCAVDPAYRGKHILHGLIAKLEEILVGKGITNAFSITRAKSVGMNMTVKRLGYTYEGTLVNNCKISTGYEDMNIWTKTLEEAP